MAALLKEGRTPETALPAAAKGVGRSTIVRALAGFGDALVTLGATRSTRYALRREIWMVGNRWPVYSIDEAGQARLWAEMEALHHSPLRVGSEASAEIL